MNLQLGSAISIKRRTPLIVAARCWLRKQSGIEEDFLSLPIRVKPVTSCIHGLPGRHKQNQNRSSPGLRTLVGQSELNSPQHWEWYLGMFLVGDYCGHWTTDLCIIVGVLFGAGEVREQGRGLFLQVSFYEHENYVKNVVSFWVVLQSSLLHLFSFKLSCNAMDFYQYWHFC